MMTAENFTMPYNNGKSWSTKLNNNNIPSSSEEDNSNEFSKKEIITKKSIKTYEESKKKSSTNEAHSRNQTRSKKNQSTLIGSLFKNMTINNSQNPETIVDDNNNNDNIPKSVSINDLIGYGIRKNLIKEPIIETTDILLSKDDDQKVIIDLDLSDDNNEDNDNNDKNAKVKSTGISMKDILSGYRKPVIDTSKPKRNNNNSNKKENSNRKSFPVTLKVPAHVLSYIPNFNDDESISIKRRKLKSGNVSKSLNVVLKVPTDILLQLENGSYKFKVNGLKRRNIITNDNINDNDNNKTLISAKDLLMRKSDSKIETQQSYVPKSFNVTLKIPPDILTQVENGSYKFKVNGLKRRNVIDENINNNKNDNNSLISAKDLLMGKSSDLKIETSLPKVNNKKASTYDFTKSSLFGKKNSKNDPYRILETPFPNKFEYHVHGFEKNLKIRKQYPKIFRKRNIHKFKRPDVKVLLDWVDLDNIDDEEEGEDDYDKNHNVEPSQLMWCEKYSPKTASQVITLGGKSIFVRNWITKSFEKLSKNNKKSRVIDYNSDVSTNASNNKKSKNGYALDDFIDDDTNDSEYCEEENGENFIPLLIINGRSSSGKTSSVYSSCREFKGYVFEINSGEKRSRRNLLDTLINASTNHLVNPKLVDVDVFYGGESETETESESNIDTDSTDTILYNINNSDNSSKRNEFQKAIILFEDVDVLYDEDTQFWPMIEKLLEVSKRPIILTCQDLSLIPKNILDLAYSNNAVVDFEIAEYEKQAKRLCEIAENEGIVSVNFEDILKLVKIREGDFRASLADLQLWGSNINNLIHDMNKDIKEEDVRESSVDSTETIVDRLSIDDFESLCYVEDFQSVIDCLENKSNSLVPHIGYKHDDEELDKLIGVNQIDEGRQLTIPSLFYETNISKYLNMKLKPKVEIIENGLGINEFTDALLNLQEKLNDIDNNQLNSNDIRSFCIDLYKSRNMTQCLSRQRTLDREASDSYLLMLSNAINPLYPNSILITCSTGNFIKEIAPIIRYIAKVNDKHNKKNLIYSKKESSYESYYSSKIDDGAKVQLQQVERRSTRSKTSTIVVPSFPVYFNTSTEYVLSSEPKFLGPLLTKFYS